MTQATVTRVIEVDVKASAQAQAHIAQIAASVQGVEQVAQKTGSALGNLMNTAKDLAKSFALMWVAEKVLEYAMALNQVNDAQKQISARMEQVTGSSSKGAAAFSEIVRIARESGRELDGVAKLYEKVSRQQEHMGLTTRGVSLMTEGFAASLKLSGAGTQEANAAMLQFSQALASGKLAGDEYRSMTENNSVFMYELGKAANKTAGELKKMSKDGKLDINFLRETMFKDLGDGENMLQKMMKKASELPQTFSQAVDGVRSALAEYLNALGQTANKSEGILTRLAKFMGNSLHQAAIESTINAKFELAKATAMGKDTDALVKKARNLTPEQQVEEKVDEERKRLQAEIKRNQKDIEFQEKRQAEGKGVDPKQIADLREQRRILQFTLQQGVSDAYKVLNEIEERKTGAFLVEGHRPDPVEVKKPKHVAAEALDSVAKFSAELDTGQKVLQAKTEEVGEWEQKWIQAWAHTTMNTKSATVIAWKELQLQKARQMDSDIEDNKLRIKRKKEEEKAEQDADAERRAKEARDLEHYKSEREHIKGLSKKTDPTSAYLDEMDRLNAFKLTAKDEKDIGYYYAAVETATKRWGDTMRKESKMVGDVMAEHVGKQFDNLINDLLDFKKSGIDIIRDFVTDFLREMAKLEMTRLMDPLRSGAMDFVRNMLGGGWTSSAATATAPRVGMNASGGVIDSPTYLGMSGGAHQVGGEAGPEAVLPLRRGANGDLGVSQTPVSVTVVNNAPNSKASAEETTDPNGNKRIVVMVEEVMAQAIGSGRMDKVLGHSFGVNRKGR